MHLVDRKWKGFFGRYCKRINVDLELAENLNRKRKVIGQYFSPAPNIKSNRFP